MEIVIACGGLPFGPATLEHGALGGAETAVLSLARELRRRGHQVTVFCPLPPPGRPDAVASGALSAEGVRYVDLAEYPGFVERVELDLLIASRDPALLEQAHQARQAVLWLHDLATYRRLRPALWRCAWRFDQAWCLSEFHRRQVHEVTGYPLESLRVLRNGIARVDPGAPVEREPGTLLYAARPERGLERLVAPDGLMAALPEFRLRVCAYELPGEEQSPYYRRLRALCEQRPNVERLGPLRPRELRRLMARSWAYVYPTAFEEVSCILARECLEQRLPVVATAVGALPETLGEAALWAPDAAAGFVAAVRRLRDEPGLHATLQARAAARADLYWDEVAARVEELAEPAAPRVLSLAWSLRQDGDLLAARAVLAQADSIGPGLDHLRRRLAFDAPALARPLPSDPLEPLLATSDVGADVALETHGDGAPETRRHGDALLIGHTPTGASSASLARFPGTLLLARLERLPGGARALVYGGGEGGEARALAEALPDVDFTLVETRPAARAGLAPVAEQRALDNLTLAAAPPASGEAFDALVAWDVVETTAEPWRALERLEGLVAPAGAVLLVARSGPWADPGRVWNPEPWMLRRLVGSKPGFVLRAEPRGRAADGRLNSLLVAEYAADGAPLAPIDPLDKARRHRARQTCAAALIARDSEQTLLQALGSLRGQVQQVQVALGPSSDRTEELLRHWAARQPELDLRLRAVPAVEAGRFGFDDARAASLEGLEADWVLWIDTDEYLTGASLGPYLRPNALDAYQVHQHHFTTEPRGAPTATDTPARLIRNDGRMRFYGKVHEQAEKGENGLSGYAYVLPDVDLGHVGYRDAATRRRRFERNRPLVDWDHALNPHRLIGQYIWVRDLVLRANLALEDGRPDDARAWARQAADFYRAEWRGFESAMGHGRAFPGLAHASRALEILGEGVALTLGAQVEGEATIHIQGRFIDLDQAHDLLRSALEAACAGRLSRYWD